MSAAAAAATDPVATVPLFIGPTWPELHRAPPPGFAVLPPAGRGDIARLLDRPPAAIAIVDGVFEVAPALWHKEILLAIEAGVAVFGAASMGALRAAELAAHGMIGVGTVYAAYASGAIERDDAVMVAHAPAALGYAPLSLALVDMIATIEAHGHALAPPEAALLRSIAELTNFRERGWAHVCGRFAREAQDPARAAAIEAMLAAGTVGAKRADAQALLRAVQAPRPASAAPAPRLAVPRTRWLRDLA